MPFVVKAAPTWIDKAGGSERAKPSVDWAKNLAFNMGSYNLLLAVGLAWVAVAGSVVAGTLGLFLAICLMGADAAAAKTRVMPAFYAQGAIGLILLIAALATGH